MSSGLGAGRIEPMSSWRDETGVCCICSRPEPTHATAAHVHGSREWKAQRLAAIGRTPAEIARLLQPPSPVEAEAVVKAVCFGL